MAAVAEATVAEPPHCAEPDGQEGSSTHGFELVVNPMSGRTMSTQADLSLTFEAEATDAEDESNDAPASGAVQAPSPAVHASTRRREKEQKGASWCLGYKHWSNCCSVVVLLCVMLTTFVYFAIQCVDGVLKEMAGTHEDPREYLGVTATVQQGASVVLIVALLHAVIVLVAITCLWRRLVGVTGKGVAGMSFPGSSSKKKKKRKKKRAKNTAANPAKLVAKAFTWVLYIKGKDSPWYYRYMWASEVWESIWQCLAIHQLSNTGMSWSLLVVYVCVVTLNTASPLIMGATLRHQRGHDGHLFLSRMTQRVLVFDASCDLFYAALPIIDLLATFAQIYICDMKINWAFQTQIAGRERFDQEYLLLAKATETFFGARTLWDIVIKVKSRVTPLIFAPRRIMSAFKLRNRLHNDIPRRLTVPQQQQQDETAGAETAASGAETSADFNSSTRQSKAWEQDEVYLPVPLPLIAIAFLPIFGFCAFALMSLLTWGTCHEAEPTHRVCLTPSFPMLDTSAVSKMCTCNTIWFEDDHASACNSSTNVARRETFESITRASRYAATVVVVLSCNESVDTTNTLLRTMELPTLVFLKGAPRAEPGMITGLPDKCHYEECDTRVMAGIAWDEIARYDTSLTMLEVTKLDMPNATFLTHLVNLRELLIRDSTLEALPADLTRLTALQILQVRATPVVAVPSVGHLISLGSLLLQSNRITEIPNSFKALTKLTYLDTEFNRIERLPDGPLAKVWLWDLSNNSLTVIPSYFGEMSLLEDLFVSNNRLTFVASELGMLTSLNRLSLWNNRLSELPESLGRLKKKKEGTSLLCKLRNNRLTRIPLSFHNLVCATFDVSGNALTEVPSVLGRWGKQLKYVDLSMNRIEAVGALGDIGSDSMKTNTVSNDAIPVLLGQNPVCGRNRTTGEANLHLPGSFDKRWKVMCEVMCSNECPNTFPGNTFNMSGNGVCDYPNAVYSSPDGLTWQKIAACNTSTCGYDGGDCSAVAATSEPEIDVFGEPESC